jgi:hypothetical protein
LCYCLAIAIRISLSVSVMRSPERSMVTVCRAPVYGKGEAARVEGDRRGDREVAVGDELAVDVQLGSAWRALPLGEIGLAGGLELEAELMPAGRRRVRR